MKSSESHGSPHDAQLRALHDENERLKQFTWAIAHDLKAPLRHLNHLIQSVKNASDTREQSELYPLIEGQLSKMDGFISGILQSYTNAPEGALEETDLNILLPNIIEFLGLRDKYTFELTPNLPILMTRKGSLQQVLMNLLENAAKFHLKQDAPIKAHCEIKEPGLILFRIEDRGKGLGPEGNIGLGLRLVKDLVKLNNGEFWTELNADGGTNVYFTWSAFTVTKQ